MTINTDERPVWLRSLAESDCDAGMPSGAEAKLLAAVRARKRAALFRHLGILAAAAALAVALWIPLSQRPKVEYQQDDDSQTLLAEAMAAADGEASDITGGFVPTFYASSVQPIESLRLVRVSVPKGALVRYGVRPQVVADVTSDEVAADLLVGQDGIARAIRINK